MTNQEIAMHNARKNNTVFEMEHTLITDERVTFYIDKTNNQACVIHWNGEKELMSVENARSLFAELKQASGVAVYRGAWNFYTKGADRVKL